MPTTLTYTTTFVAETSSQVLAFNAVRDAVGQPYDFSVDDVSLKEVPQKFGPELLLNSGLDNDAEHWGLFDMVYVNQSVGNASAILSGDAQPTTVRQITDNTQVYRLSFTILGEVGNVTVYDSASERVIGVWSADESGSARAVEIYTTFDVVSPTLFPFVFQTSSSFIGGEIKNVSLKAFENSSGSSVSDSTAVAEFLSTNTDYGGAIIFRADTQQIQLMTEFETYGVPLAIVTKLQRGSLVKCFVALDDGDFYELTGNATKGVSIIKIQDIQNKTVDDPSVAVAREMRLSWRDSSKQLCRLSQGGIVFLSTTLNHSK